MNGPAPLRVSTNPAAVRAPLLSRGPIRTVVAESRAAQGLPPTVEDPVVLRKLGTLLEMRPRRPS